MIFGVLQVKFEMKFFILCCAYLTLFSSRDIVSALKCYECFRLLGLNESCQVDVNILDVDVEICDDMSHEFELECYAYVGTKEVIRGCGADNTCERLTKRKQAKYCRLCKTDLCNNWALIS